MCCPGERVKFISSLWPPWKKIRRRAHNIQIIMYLFMVATVADIAFQNASSKWIRIIVQNPRSNLTLYFGVWRYCAQGYDCNGDQGKCSTVHRCRFVTDDDMKAHPESLTSYRAARSFAFVTVLLVLAVVNVTIFCGRKYRETNFIRNATVCLWTAASKGNPLVRKRVTAGLSNFAFLNFGYNLNIDDLVVITAAHVNFGLAFAMCWLSMLLMFVLIFLAHINFTGRIRPYRHVLYQPVSEIQDTSSAISLYIASAYGGSLMKAAVIQNPHASAAKDGGGLKQHAY